MMIWLINFCLKKSPTLILYAVYISLKAQMKALQPPKKKKNPILILFKENILF
jgi:hypothetical protein